MKKYTRSLIATGIALALVACNDDSSVNDGKELPASQPVTIEVNGAKVTGLTESNEITALSGNKEVVRVEAFKGIKFADGERFQHSSLVKVDGSTDIDATEFGYICPQLGETGEAQAEDCLNLNIWRPAGTEANAELPVYVFIHGGSFESGSGSTELNRGDTIVAQSISDYEAGDRSEPFIAVSVNYRLGLLGSLWVDGKENPKGGNYGIGDQKRALEWINDYISEFGGDAGNVTVYGESAGAMSIGILQEDKDVAGQDYQRAIMQSNPYGIAYKNYASAQSIWNDVKVAVTGSEDTADKNVQDLLADMSLEEVKGLQQNLKGNLLSYLIESKPSTSGFLPFAPYIEKKAFGPAGHHLTKQPLSNTDFNVETVIGFNTDESNLFTSMFEPLLYANIKNKDGEFVLGGDVVLQEDFIIEGVIELPKGTSVRELLEHEAIGGMYGILVKAFFGGIPKVSESIPGNCDVISFAAGLCKGQQLFSKVSDYKPELGSGYSLEMSTANIRTARMLANDMLFTCPSRKVVQNNVATSTTMYHYEHESQFNFWPFDAMPLASLSCQNLDGLKGKACHAAELPFVFGKAINGAGQPVLTNAKDNQVMAAMSREWFKDTLFTDNEWESGSDNYLKIGGEGNIFESAANFGADDSAIGARCDDLEAKGLLDF